MTAEQHSRPHPHRAPRAPVRAGALSSLVWVFFLSSLVSLPHAVTHEKPELDPLDQLELEGARLGEQPMHSVMG